MLFFGLMGLCLQTCGVGPGPPRPDTGGWGGWDSAGWDTDWWDTGGGEGCDALDTTLDRVEQSFVDTLWRHDVYTVGWMSSPDLLVTRAAEPAWTELHPFPAGSFDYDPGGCWDHFRLDLRLVADTSAVVEGETTLFTEADGPNLSYAILIYDIDQRAVGCWSWGLDPASAATAIGTSCDVI